MRHAQLLNYALYQAGWFACVLGAAWDWPVTGFAVAMLLLAVHFVLAHDRAGEARLVLAAVLAGLAVESFQIAAGSYRILSGAIVAWLPPPWLLALWAQFATTFRFSMSHIMAHPRRAALFGAAGGPIAFWAGDRLGAVALLPPAWAGLLRMAVTWALAVAWLALLTRRERPQDAPAGYRARLG